MMNDDPGISFIFQDPFSDNFIFKTPYVENSNNALAQNANIVVKFAQRQVFLDPWRVLLKGKNRWERIIFRFKHPIAYSKRGLRKLYNKIKKIFIKDKIVQCMQRNKIEQ